MIEAEQDVLNAKAQIRRSDFSGTWRGLNNERRVGRRKPLGLCRTAKVFDPNQHVSRRR